jgi:hypothetical protein
MLIRVKFAITGGLGGRWVNPVLGWAPRGQGGQLTRVSVAPWDALGPAGYCWAMLRPGLTWTSRAGVWACARARRPGGHPPRPATASASERQPEPAQASARPSPTAPPATRPPRTRAGSAGLRSRRGRCQWLPPRCCPRGPGLNTCDPSSGDSSSISSSPATAAMVQRRWAEPGRPQRQEEPLPPPPTLGQSGLASRRAARPLKVGGPHSRSACSELGREIFKRQLGKEKDPLEEV